MRVRKAFSSKAGAVPPLYTMQKDHKERVEGEDWPPSRPVCGASMAMTSRLGDLICELIERVADGVEGSCESKSGEDMMEILYRFFYRVFLSCLCVIYAEFLHISA